MLKPPTPAITDAQRLDWLERLGFSTVDSGRFGRTPGVHSWRRESGEWGWTAHWINSDYTDARSAIDAAMRMEPKK